MVTCCRLIDPATGERSFSMTRRLKTWPRANIKYHEAIMHTHKARTDKTSRSENRVNNTPRSLPRFWNNLHVRYIKFSPLITQSYNSKNDTGSGNKNSIDSFDCRDTEMFPVIFSHYHPCNVICSNRKKEKSYRNIKVSKWYFEG